MLTRTDIIKALQDISDYEVSEKDVTKNGVVLQGITFNMGIIAPVVYTEDIIKEATEKSLSAYDIATQIIDLIEKDTKINKINPETLTDPEYIKDHVKIGLQRETTENLVKAGAFQNIEKYLYIISDDNDYSAKITPELLEHTGINTKELWEIAEKNTFEDTCITSLVEMLSKRFGIPMEDTDTMPLYIVTNKSGIKGAANILDKKALKDFGKSHGIKEVFVLPSSIHECLLMPVTAGMDIKDLSAMVSGVNGETVDPLEQLADNAFILKLY